MNEKKAGKIKYLNVDKGYGFISYDTAMRDMFFHVNGVTSGYRPQVGDTVWFSVESATNKKTGELRDQAVDVEECPK